MFFTLSRFDIPAFPLAAIPFLLHPSLSLSLSLSPAVSFFLFLLFEWRRSSRRTREYVAAACAIVYDHARAVVRISPCSYVFVTRYRRKQITATSQAIGRYLADTWHRHRHRQLVRRHWKCADPTRCAPAPRDKLTRITKMAATHLDVGLRCIKYLLCAVNSLFVVCIAHDISQCWFFFLVFLSSSSIFYSLDMNEILRRYEILAKIAWRRTRSNCDVMCA